MKVEGWLFLGAGVFLAGADIIYWYTSYEVTGTTALALAVAMCLLIGFHTTFLVQHWIGDEGMVRRIPVYPGFPGSVTTLNQVSSVGSWILTLSILIFMYNVYKTHRYGEKLNVEDPWGFGSSLEWATSCPPPRHNFYRIPRIRSERPAFELHYPHLHAVSDPRAREVQGQQGAPPPQQG